MKLSSLLLPFALLAGSALAQGQQFQTIDDILVGGASTLGELDFGAQGGGDNGGGDHNGGDRDDRHDRGGRHDRRDRHGRRDRHDRRDRRDRGGCNDRCSWPQPRCVDRTTLPVVTPDCFTVSGRCLDLIDEVFFGCERLAQDGTIGDGTWRVSDDGRELFVCPPQCWDPGCYRVTLKYRGCRVASFNVRLTTPTRPMIACDSELRVGEQQCVYIHDGGQARPNNLFILVSPERVPSVIPGVISLEIGNNFQNYLCGVTLTGPCAEECIGTVPASAVGLKLYFQGVVFNPSGDYLPLPTTDVCETSYID